MQTANYIVYRDNPMSGTYHAEKAATGEVIASDPNAAGPVLQAALDADLWNDPTSGPGSGDVYVRSGHYLLGPGFSGLKLRTLGKVTLDPTAFLEVPSGYTGEVFTLESNNIGGAVTEVQHAEIRGGVLRETTPTQSRWTGFALRASATVTTAGVLFNRLCDTVLYSPGIAVLLDVTSDHGFITSNTISFLRIWNSTTGIEFRTPASYQLGVQTSGILYNTFSDLHLEKGANYACAITGVSGVHNEFNSVRTWDVPAGKPAMQISATADRTLILGGTLAGESSTNGYIDDKGHATKII